MIHVLNRSSGEVSLFEGEAWLKPTRTCPAPCCDVACEVCPADGDCPHSNHGADGFCLIRRDGDELRCEAYFAATAGIEFSDCACAVANACEHSQALRARAIALVQAIGRPAGLQRERFLASRAPVEE